MHKQFKELYDILVIDRQKSAWSKEQTLKDRCNAITDEVAEAQEALLTSDNKHIADELGDVLWDVLAAIVIAEEQGITTIDEILASKIEKIKRRKPWIFGDEYVGFEEELRWWKKIKRQEVEQGIRRA